MTRRLATERDIDRLVAKLATAVRRACRTEKNLALVGIRRRGVPLSERIAARLNRNRPRRIPVGAMDITLYRDDLQLVAETPIVRGSEINFDINGRTVILVDDVIYTGRTIRAALTELLDFGRPKAVRLAVLVDRGLRELPIQPDFAGLVLETRPTDIVDIYLTDTDGREGIFLTCK
jgi:pyrimidine operon attenuation protein/uracil phosphoribosyltransferase